MKFANLEAQKKMMEFMVKEFLPVWEEAVFKYMDEQQTENLSEDEILERIHSKLYLEEGFSVKENEIFKSVDPAGHQRFIQSGFQEAMDKGIQ